MRLFILACFVMGLILVSAAVAFSIANAVGVGCG